MATNDAVTFIRNASRIAFPSSVSKHLRVRVLDTLAATTAGYQLSTSGIIHDYATDRFANVSEATLLDGTGNRASLEATTLTNATAANALDIDDGHREVKGHPAAIVVPAALAAAEVRDATISAFLDAVLVGYEIGTRVGLAIHATDDVYTGTGSWGAVGAAAAVGRLFGFDAETLRAALGIAEYHAPRTPIMRGVEQPGMTKDGIGWGAYAGVASALLAERGFTGSGTVFDENTIEVTDSLGKQFHVTNGYLKPYPCCRWAQPGVAATLALDDRHRIDPDTVRRVQIETFEAAIHLRTSEPDSAEAAEYSYPYPVATAVARGRFTPEDLQAAAREDPTIVSLANQVELTVNEALEEQFPAKCLARVTIETDTETYRSNVMEPPGARSRPLSTAKRLMKARQLLTPALDESEIVHLRTQLTHPNRPISTLLDPWHKEE